MLSDNTLCDALFTHKTISIPLRVTQNHAVINSSESVFSGAHIIWQSLQLKIPYVIYTRKMPD
jgi:hypothetical protein